jgi:hypothetical protein
MIVLEVIGVALLFLAIYAVMSLPAILVIWIVWKLTFGMRSVLAQSFLRAGVLAIALTPTYSGHGGPMPLYLFAVFLKGQERLGPIRSIAMVWLISTAILYTFVRTREFRVGHKVKSSPR